MSTAVFDRLYRSSSDPWSADTRWYERRKRSLIVAALSRPRYRRGFEAGCGNGHLALPLAARCDSFVASDASAEAVALARRRATHDSTIEFRQLSLPDEWPEGRFDLIVLSEVLYFLDSTSIRITAAKVGLHLASEGEVIACNWRAQIEGYGHSGDQVHRDFEQALGLPRRFAYVDDDFALGGWSTHASVASTDHVDR